MNRRLVPLLLAAALSPAAAADFAVDRFDDPAPDGCTPGHCSLREAVGAANASNGPDRILLPAGLFVLSLPGDAEDANLSGDLDVRDALEIVGQGSAASLVQQDAVDRLLEVDDAFFVRLQGVTLRGATHDEGQGAAALYAQDTTMELIDVAVVDNVGHFTGGVRFNATANTQPFPRLTIRNSRFEGNAGGTVGALHLFAQGEPIAPFALIEDTSFIANTGGTPESRGFGGAIYMATALTQESNQLVMRRVTMTANTARNPGGAIYLVHNGGAGPSLLLEDSELCNNRSDYRGGAIDVETRAVIRRSTFCNNVVTASDPLAEGGGAINASSTLDGVVLTLERSTFSNNAAPQGGALRLRRGNATVAGTTITAPLAVPVGTQGTVFYQSGDGNGSVLTFRDNLWQGSCAFEAANEVPFLARYNVEAPNDTCRFTLASNNAGNHVAVATSTLRLGPLAANGGPTRTRPPAIDSVAIDAAQPGSCVLLDQRGYLGGDSRCDAGAIERSASVDGLQIHRDGFE